MNSVINPKYLHLSDFLLSLATEANVLSPDKVLRSGRNEVWLFTVEGQRIVVKSFRKFSALNRVVYGSIRRSKAVRAYYNALRLRKLGINTPEPIAAIDIRRWGVMMQSFYVYAYSEYGEMDSLLEDYPCRELEPLLDALTDFILRIHDNGVLHHDFNILNILYRDCGGGKYDFQLIDINRMDFHAKLTTNQRLTNLRHFNCKPAAFMYILERYAAAMNMNCEQVQLRCMSMRLMDTIRHKFKQRIKTLL